LILLGFCVVGVLAEVADGPFGGGVLGAFGVDVPPSSSGGMSSCAGDDFLQVGVGNEHLSEAIGASVMVCSATVVMA
jgi:hypothetical protein